MPQWRSIKRICRHSGAGARAAVCGAPTTPERQADAVSLVKVVEAPRQPGPEGKSLMAARRSRATHRPSLAAAMAFGATAQTGGGRSGGAAYAAGLP